MRGVVKTYAVLPDAENHADTDAQQVLPVAGSIGQLRAQVIGLNGVDGEVPVHGQVKAAACQHRQRTGGTGRGTVRTWEQTVEAVSDAHKPLHEGRVPGKFLAREAQTVSRPGGDRDQR